MPIAIKRLTKELSNLMNEDLDDFKILDSNDIMNWKASIYGPKNSIFEGGKYDLEILPMPRIYFEDVEIKQSKTTEITIPLYGSVQISKGTGPASLFLKEKGQNIWLYDFNNFRYIENLNLQPGKYMISFRNSRSNSMAHTIIKEFKISSGQNLNLNL